MDFRTIFNGLLHYTNHFLMCPTAMIRASVYQDVGVYNQAVFCNTADMEMWLRISRKYPIGILEERLLRYRHFHDSSSLRYHRLRTEPGRYYTIMDMYLDQGARGIATPDALAAHEAHRAEDLLMITTSNYILDNRPKAREILSRIRLQHLLGSPRIQRGRLFILYLILRVLMRLPRISAVAGVFNERWHNKKQPRRTAAATRMARGSKACAA